jgi:hypothetical protein
MEPKLADSGKLAAQATIEIFDDFRVALHDPSKPVRGRL